LHSFVKDSKYLTEGFLSSENRAAFLTTKTPSHKDFAEKRHKELTPRMTRASRENIACRYK
jgi:hypothetical protein